MTIYCVLALSKRLKSLYQRWRLIAAAIRIDDRERLPADRTGPILALPRLQQAAYPLVQVALLGLAGRDGMVLHGCQQALSVVLGGQD